MARKIHAWISASTNWRSCGWYEASIHLRNAVPSVLHGTQAPHVRDGSCTTVVHGTNRAQPSGMSSHNTINRPGCQGVLESTKRAHGSASHDRNAVPSDHAPRCTGRGPPVVLLPRCGTRDSRKVYGRDYPGGRHTSDAAISYNGPASLGIVLN